VNRPRWTTIALFGTAIVLFASLAAAVGTAVGMRRATQAEQDFFRNAVFGRSATLNRTVIAAADYQSVPVVAVQDADAMAQKNALARAVTSHAAISGKIDPDAYTRFISDDPLVLLPRLLESERTYQTALEELTRAAEALADDVPLAEGRRLLEEYDRQFAAFFRLLKDRSYVLTQLEGTYHAQLRSNEHATSRSVNTTMALLAVAVLLSSAVVFLAYRSQARQVAVLEGLIPICSHCHKVRDDKGYWSQVDTYIRKRTNASFSHGICPDCLVKHYPELTPDKRA
jgi:hypothetical protein